MLKCAYWESVGFRCLAWGAAGAEPHHSHRAGVPLGRCLIALARAGVGLARGGAAGWVPLGGGVRVKCLDSGSRRGRSTRVVVVLVRLVAAAAAAA